MIPDMEKSIPWSLWSNVSDRGTWDDQSPQGILLPPSLEAREWKRFHEIEDVTPVLHDSTNSPDLFCNNQHLLKSEFIKWFCSTLRILNYCHQVDGKRWQGWHHIYSPNKSLNDPDHNPQLNPDGKYMVRLFFMGFWRCFIVDDTIPLGYDGLPLLPRTQNRNELWPMILAKGVWQIASLSAINDCETADFNSFLCFTGWTWWSQNVSPLPPRDRWGLLTKYSGNPSDSRSHPISSDEPPTKNTVPEIPRDRRKAQRNSKNKRPSETTAGAGEKTEGKGPETKEDFPILTLLYLHDNEVIRKDHDEVSEIPSGYPIFIGSTSDRPSDPTQIKLPIERWRLSRWVPWAVRQGIIDPKAQFSPTRRVLVLPLGATDPQLHWVDFNDFTEHPMDFHFLFKGGYFRCSEAVSNMSNRHSEARSEGQLEEKNKNRRFHYFYDLKPSRNEPLYLLVDSLDDKLLLVNFWVYGQHWSSLVIQKCSWFRRDQGKNLLNIRTRGCASRTICLGPGRHLLRVFCQVMGYYWLTVSSNTDFRVGERREVQELMTAESERIKALGADVRRKLATAVDSLGAMEHVMDWRNFCESYMPRGRCSIEDLSKVNRVRIHEAFRAEALHVLEEKCRGDVGRLARRALKIFFMIEVEGDGRQSEIGGDDDDGAEEIGRNAAVKIQGFFRMLRMKKFLEIRTRRVAHQGVNEGLQKVLEVFDEESMGELMRRFIIRIEDFRGCYDWTSDLENVLGVQKMTGRAVVSSPGWIPMVRYNVMVRGEETVFALMDLFVDLPGYSLRCFDNDTTREIQRAVNNVMPFHYRRNRRGFTVLGYGRSDLERTTEVQWTLHITTMKGSPQFYGSISPLPPMIEANPAVHELSNIYIPNSNNYIAKAILRVSTSSTVSLRLQVSYSRTRIKVRISSETSEKFQEVSGGPVVLVPVVNLDDCEVEYFIHAFVVGDSWPLTADDWRCVEKAKRDVKVRILKTLSSSSGENFQRAREMAGSPEDSVEGPRWSLQILGPPGTAVELREDTRRDLEILQTKITWESQDPGRSHRGKNLREKFRAENCIQLFEEEDEVPSDVDEEVRTLSPPRDHRRLPPLNLSTLRDSADVGTMSRELSNDNMRRKKLLEFEKKSKHLMQRLGMTMTSSLRVPTQ